MSPKRAGTAALWGFYGVVVLVVPPPAAPPAERSEEYLHSPASQTLTLMQRRKCEAFITRLSRPLQDPPVRLFCRDQPEPEHRRPGGSQMGPPLPLNESRANESSAARQAGRQAGIVNQEHQRIPACSSAPLQACGADLNRKTSLYLSVLSRQPKSRESGLMRLR